MLTNGEGMRGIIFYSHFELGIQRGVGTCAPVTTNDGKFEFKMLFREMKWGRCQPPWEMVWWLENGEYKTELWMEMDFPKSPALNRIKGYS